ncbi:SPASM domain-containing protein [Candidatus Woesearchaeota archaeon]|nr:SPASM domain-containing protein [Candidatus Woesearchaeota archaeon]
MGRRSSFTDPMMTNLALNRNEREQRKTVLKSYPIKIFVEPTSRCNLSCPMCGNRNQKRTADMDLPLFRKIERELFPHVAGVDFYLNGEPTIAENFPLMIQTAEKYLFMPRIFTNGNCLSEQTMEDLVRVGFSVTFSIDTVDPATYREMRPGGDMSRVTANIRRLAAIQRRIRNPRFHMRIAATLGMQNVAEGPKMVRFAKGLGIREVAILAMSGGSRSPVHLSCDPEKSVFYLKRAKRLADRLSVRISLPRLIGGIYLDEYNNWDSFRLPVDGHFHPDLEEATPFNGMCPFPWTQAAFRADGSVVPCSHTLKSMGDMRTASFREIWNSRGYRLLRSKSTYYRCLGSRCNLAFHSY